MKKYYIQYITACYSHSHVMLMCFLGMVFYSLVAAAENNIEFLDKKIIRNLNASVFEVVVPKLESDTIKYTRELPFHKLGYKERNEKFHSIGTAFFINDRELMSAAHVFGLQYFSLWQDFYIRDLEGVVYKVGKLKKLSFIRDMVIFELEDYPPKFLALGFSENVEIGDTVFSVGNAQGEGISFRAGQIASFTMEPEYGQWKNIRFTSPASPGNSGGPLIDINGNVLGVIIRKNSSENYNIAVPISEAKDLKNKAEYHLRNISMMLSDAQNSVIEDWSETIDLPDTVKSVAKRAQKSLNDFYEDISAKLYKTFEDSYMPKGERFRAYLRDQVHVNQFGVLSSDADFNTWTLNNHPARTIPIEEDQSISIAKSQISDFHLRVEKPKDISLKEFVGNPALVMDNMLKAFPLSRTVGREKIRLVSLGKPEKTEIMEDKLGRNWVSSFWYLPHIDFFVYSHCLAYPKGVICNVDVKKTSDLMAGYLATIMDNFSEIVIGYEGELSDWIEYLSLPAKYLPKSFADSKITFSGDTLEVNTRSFRIKLNDSMINNKSGIHFHFGYSNKDLLAEDLLLFELFPDKGVGSNYRIQKFFSPSPFSSDNYKSEWGDLSARSGDYSGKIVNKSKQKSIHKVVPSTEETFTSIHGKEISRVFVVGCFFKTSEEHAAEKCDSFSGSVNFYSTLD